MNCLFWLASAGTVIVVVTLIVKMMLSLYVLHRLLMRLHSDCSHLIPHGHMLV